VVEIPAKIKCASMIDIPSWIQAGADVALMVLTGATLWVLKGYAADTKKIAKASHPEHSQMPFLTVAWRHSQPTIPAGWELQNQGFGPALNVRFSVHSNEGEEWRSIADMAKGQCRSEPEFHEEIRKHLQNGIRNRTFTIKYTSLSGLPYVTKVERLHNNELQTTFLKPPE